MAEGAAAKVKPLAGAVASLTSYLVTSGASAESIARAPITLGQGALAGFVAEKAPRPKQLITGVLLSVVLEGITAMAPTPKDTPKEMPLASSH
jgi:hypothetical protein